MISLSIYQANIDGLNFVRHWMTWPVLLNESICTCTKSSIFFLLQRFV